MGLLRALPLPVRLIFLALVGVLVTRLLKGYGWLFGATAAVLWIVAALTLLETMPFARGLGRMPGLGVLLAWIGGRAGLRGPPSVAAGPPGAGTSSLGTGSVGPSLPPAAPSDEERDRMLEEASRQLVGLRGIDEARNGIAGFMDVSEAAQGRGQPGLGTSTPAVLLALTGGRGTGKTTVAHLLGPLLCGHRTLDRPQVSKVTDQDLAAGYGGRVGPALQQAAGAAVGGVLLLDDADWMAEASPSGGPSAGLDAGRGIIRAAEASPGRLVVALTMSEASFLRLANDADHRAAWLGKLSVEQVRFPQVLPEDDLLALLLEQLSGHDLVVEPDGAAALRGRIRSMQRELDPQFDNAIAMRRLAERIARQLLERTPHHGMADAGTRGVTLSDLRELAH